MISVDDSPVPEAQHLVQNIHWAHDMAKDAIKEVQKKYVLYANKKRLPDPEFKPFAALIL